MSEGHKLTALGDIPKSWEVVEIREVLESFQNGYAFSATGYVKNGIPIVSMANISLVGNFQFEFDKCKFWDVDRSKNLSNYFLKKGDVIVAMTDVTPTKNLIGRMAEITIDGEFLLNQRVGLLRVNPFKISNQYLKFVGNSDAWIKYCQKISSQGAQANIGTNDIKRSLIPLPPLPEQQKIASILSTVDEKIEVIDAQISQTQELKKGLMQQLLSKGIGHTRFKSSELGDIPESWEVVRLGAVGNLTGGFAFKSSSFNTEETGYQVIRMSNIQSYGLELKKSPIYIAAISKSEERFLLRKGDLLITLTGTVNKTDYGNVAYISESDTMVLNQRVGRFEYSEKMAGKFLYYYFNSENFRRKFFESGSGGTGNQANVGKSGFESIMVIVPSLDEQQKIASILTTVDEKLNSLNFRKETYQLLKKGLMQQLLTGKIRVNTSQNEPSLA